jgi:integrase/recombinase XerD
MTALERHLDDYLAIRHGLGFKLVTEQRVLRRFVAFMDDAGEPSVTVALALRWATIPTGVGHAYLAQRMRAVRGFARYLHGIDPATEVPSLELLPARKHRPTPHIYSQAEIAALMTAARTLRPALRAATMEALVCLLACTGLRDGEAFALDRTDIDRANGLLRVLGSKFGKSREILVGLSQIITVTERRSGPSAEAMC